MKAKVTISRCSDDTVRIRFRDVASNIEFAEAIMTPEAFGYAITGLSEMEADLRVSGLQNVGKKRIVEQRQIDCPLKTFRKEELRAWLRENAQEEGWILNDYLGSQNSVSYPDGKTLLRYSVTKYVEEADLAVNEEL